jgi:hypothetical protein
MDDAPHEPANICTHHVFMMVHVITGRVFSDNTGHFPGDVQPREHLFHPLLNLRCKCNLVSPNQEQKQRGAPVGHHRNVHLAYSPGISAHPPQNGQ